MLHKSLFRARDLLCSADLAAIDAAPLYDGAKSNDSAATGQQRKRRALMTELKILPFAGEVLSTGLRKQQEVPASGLILITDLCRRVPRNHV
jgi:hypothetical protein